ncbi:hypothetical protein BDZ85DRAFT_64676 [Elsinoe ampelina]|uniref:N-acetyltransferase domain-containing protein n=1 Tax=Elsinoe ampelina TaxID=302913 RepID=A0A6A6FZL2_9PEZI|nr:hypothetical protein BDZ85DRAFT_64676 [Elsinoe ampelina]
MASHLKLEDVTLSDRAAIADIIARANFEDPYGQTVWPGSTIDSRIAGGYARLAKTFIHPGHWFKKVTLDGKPIAYAQWTFPIALWQRLNAESGGGMDGEADADMKKQFKQEANESCVSPGWPKGLRREVVEACSPAMEEAHARVFAVNEDFIFLDQVKTLPDYQGKGAGSMLVQWGAELADKEGLPTRLEATPFGMTLYKKFDFEGLAEVHHDVSRFGGPSRYTHTLMVRKSKKD